MAGIALLAASCAKDTAQEKDPISKPQITIEGGRLTPEALWAMGRIGDVAIDTDNQRIAYTVSYYSVSENRSTTWIRICDLGNGQLEQKDEFVGSSPAWTKEGQLAYLKDGKLYFHVRRGTSKDCGDHRRPLSGLGQSHRKGDNRPDVQTLGRVDRECTTAISGKVGQGKLGR